MNETDRLVRIRQWLAADDTKLAFKTDARWLLAELDRVTAERDLLATILAAYPEAVLERDDASEFTRSAVIDKLVAELGYAGTPAYVGTDVAAAMSEHDRKFRETNP